MLLAGFGLSAAGVPGGAELQPGAFQDSLLVGILGGCSFTWAHGGSPSMLCLAADLLHWHAAANKGVLGLQFLRG